jgi:hypothetical protein
MLEETSQEEQNISVANDENIPAILTKRRVKFKLS